MGISRSTKSGSDPGHLYDVRVPYLRPSIADVATEIAACLAEGDGAGALRLAFRCVELYERAPLDERPQVVEREPTSTGDLRYDALLAAIAEYVCARDSVVAPRWVEASERFLGEWWFVSGMKSLYAEAIAHSPISFARRGVFITSGALTYA
jgi:hypothetical protein